ncbi:beta-galactosidase [Dictyobacter kobayashii]|uniref:Uncharacterized protein n=1 Tax=Dictyobacter kobayashii TaxID=2014872 RepID=A0A402AWM4_9CHLR|nr:beta-galactosidase [Dictyobacter kobayashii]GCE23423.1 hypothetical protein KDK_72230 [Dictyobacter kobayashii]
MNKKSISSFRRPAKVLKILMVTLVLSVLISIFLLYYFQPGTHKLSISDRDRPYGMTVYNTLRQQTVKDLQQLNINWVRYQQNWSSIEPQPGHYNWQQLDNAVALANTSHIHMSFPLQTAPRWALRQTCASRLLFPGATEMAAYGRAVAQRYNGKNGHGYIESYEIGNEEFDSLWTGNWNESISCRQPYFYGPILKATYSAVKAASPGALVGMAAIWWVNTPHIQDYMQWLYQHDLGSSFDFANFHYYVCANDPASTAGERPSFDKEWQLIHYVMSQYGDGQKPIWATEIGWNTSGVAQDVHCIISPQTQANYLLKTAQMAMASHIIRHIFWYTIDQGNDGMSLTQPTGNLPGYKTLQDFIHHNPTWSP